MPAFISSGEISFDMASVDTDVRADSKGFTPTGSVGLPKFCRLFLPLHHRMFVQRL